MSKLEEEKRIHSLINHMFESIELDAPELNDWEENFLISIKEQFNASGTLSTKQRKILERIYSEKIK